LDSNNLYYARVAFGSNQALTLVLQKRVGGSQTDIASQAIPGTHAVGAKFSIRFNTSGSTLRAKAWPVAEKEPANWQITTTDTALTSAGSVGVRTIVSSISTAPLPITFSVDDFRVFNRQRFSTVRSVNDVVKTHSPGDAVKLARSAIVAL
jgi:hypothetical protein